MDNLEMRKADKLEVSVLVDNYSDLLLEDSEKTKRLRIPPPGAPMAEHGLSLLVKVTDGDEDHTVLMDTGISGTCLQHNAGVLAASMAVGQGAVTNDVRHVESIVLSHGHFDHFNGLGAFFHSTGKKIPLVLHPGAFVQRRLKIDSERYLDMVSLEETALEQMGAVLDKRSSPSTVASGLVLVSGEVERSTGFEKGSPALEAKIDGSWMTDPFYDDQAIAVHIKSHGLVVIGGCSHAGIINTIKHIQKVTGTERVHAVLGGFHLAGPDTAVVEATIEEMKKIGPDLIIPMHCTGWNTIRRFSDEMPGQFILNSVGTTYLFNS